MNSINPNYNLPPLRKIGPAVLPKPKNIKIQAGRAIINFSSDGSSNRPTITISTNNRNCNDDTSLLANLDHHQIHSQKLENKSNEGLSYNIPIQYVQKTHPPPPPPIVNYQLKSNNTRNNFIVPVQEQKTKTKTNFSAYDNSNLTSYTIPVNVSRSNHTDIDDNKNVTNINLTDDETDTENEVNSNHSQHQQQITGQHFHKDFQANNNLKITEKTKANSIDEVDLLKDLLMKNLNASSDPNFFGMCMKCNEKIYGADNGLRAMDQLFHVTCFSCQGCNQSLQGQHFYAMDKKSFCENCYMKLLERCTICDKAITERILRATGKPFHPECFSCIVCANNLDGIPFTVDASNKIHCIDCFHDKYAPRCFICNDSIVPELGNEETIRIVAMDKSFHVQCYKCEDCGISLASNAENVGGCFPLDDHILCKSCNINRIRNLVTNHDLQNDTYGNQKLLRNRMHQLTQNNLNYNARSTDL